MLKSITILVCLCCVLCVGCDILNDPTRPTTQTSATNPVSTQEDLAAEKEDDADGFCTGTELICLSQMTPDSVAKAGGRVLGGSFQDGEFLSSAHGGLAFQLAVNTSRAIRIEFELAGNIANWQRGETDGGKVAVLTIHGGTYYFSLQRHERHYRGGGLFRGILADRPDPLKQGAAFLITSSDISGYYSMANWGNETHEFAVTLQGGSCQLEIDSYTSRPASAPYGIGGSKNVTFVLGNRELSRIFLGEGAQTRFLRVKVYN